MTFSNKDFKFILKSDKKEKDKVVVEEIRQVMNIDQTVSDDVCKICFTLKHSIKINCESNTPHCLCYYCYKRMIVIEELKQCPFDRTDIK